MSYLTKFLTVFALSIFATTSILAQTGATVSGKVLLKGGELSNVAKVKIVSQSNSSQIFETTTTAREDYEFRNVPNGRYTIYVESVDEKGINFVEQGSFRVENNQNVRFDFNLTSPPLEVVVTASDTEQKIDEVSKSISVVTNSEIQQRNEITVTDAVRTVAGLNVRQLGGFGRLASIQTRGLRAQDTAVLIDGFRFRDASTPQGDASSLLSDLTPVNVDRIEVLRGSGSSLYGTNAIGGVVNIISDDNGGKFHGNVLGEGGGLGFLRGRAEISQGLFDNQLRYSAGFSQNYFGKGVDGDDLARNSTAQGRIGYNLNSNTTISGRFYGNKSFVKLNSSPDTIGVLPATGIINAVALSRKEQRRYENGQAFQNIGNANFIADQNDPDSFQKSHFAVSGVSFKQFYDRFSYDLSFQNVTTQRKTSNGERGVSFQPFGGSQRYVYDGAINTFRARGDAQLLSNNLLTFGYEYEREKFSNDGFAPTVADNFSTKATQTSNAVFVQDQLNFLNRSLQFSGAFRAQVFKLGTPQFSQISNAPYNNLTLDNAPNSYTADGSAAYFVRSTNTKIRGHVGNGYRIPSLYERFGTFFSSFSGGFIALGDPNLKPERSIAVDGGVDQSFDSNRVKLSATYFYTQLQQTIFYDFAVNPIGTTSRPFGGYRNTNGGIARGIELSAEFSPSVSTRVFTSYTFTKSQQVTPQISGSEIIKTLNQPTNQFSFVASQRIGRSLDLNVDFVAASSNLGAIFPTGFPFVTRIYRFEGLRKLDLTGSYTIPTSRDNLSFRLFGQVENLTNQKYFDAGFRAAGVRGRGGLQVNF